MKLSEAEVKVRSDNIRHTQKLDSFTLRLSSEVEILNRLTDGIGLGEPFVHRGLFTVDCTSSYMRSLGLEPRTVGPVA